MSIFEITVTCPGCRKATAFHCASDRNAFACDHCQASIPMTVVRRRGAVYVLRNECMPGLVKIGQTMRDVFDRARELSSTSGVPVPFEVVAYFLTDDPVTMEAAVHDALSGRRRPNREFFEMHAAEAVAAVEETLGVGPHFRLRTTSAASSQSMRARRLDADCMHCGAAWSATVLADAVTTFCPECGRQIALGQ